VGVRRVARATDRVSNIYHAHLQVVYTVLRGSYAEPPGWLVPTAAERLSPVRPFAARRQWPGLLAGGGSQGFKRMPRHRAARFQSCASVCWSAWL